MDPDGPLDRRGLIRVDLLHLNDVYEITPTGDGSAGGLARVATLLGDMRADNPNTFAILAGDLLSPSALGTATVDGERLQGRQMVAVLNAVALDFATFGNHEFDLDEAPFRSRLNESTFEWLSANVVSSSAEALPNVASHRIIRVAGAAGDTFRLALFGVTMDRDQSDYVRISDPVATGTRHANLLLDSADALVGVTHMSFAEDAALALAVPGIDLIVGGHDHQNLLIRRGPGLTPIAKADANALTVWHHRITWTPGTDKVAVQSRLLAVTDSIGADPATAAVAADWVRRAYAGFVESGFDPERIVARSTVPLDGLESSILNDTTALSRIIADAMVAEVDGAVASIYNAGAIRLDDVMPAGPVSEYDVIRILPFGGPVVEVEVRGDVLRRVLEQGERNRGTGGFLHSAGTAADADGGRSIAGSPLDDGRSYRIAISEFLLSGREQGLDWFVPGAPGVRVVAEHRDVRYALIDQLARTFPER